MPREGAHEDATTPPSVAAAPHRNRRLLTRRAGLLPRSPYPSAILFPFERTLALPASHSTIGQYAGQRRALLTAPDALLFPLCGRDPPSACGRRRAGR